MKNNLKLTYRWATADFLANARQPYFSILLLPARLKKLLLSPMLYSIARQHSKLPPERRTNDNLLN